MDDLERRRDRLARARLLIRGELAIAFAVPLIALFLYIAAPGYIGPMVVEPWLLERVLPFAGIAGVVIGLAWMVWLSRPNPETGERTWRYRDF